MKNRLLTFWRLREVVGFFAWVWIVLQRITGQRLISVKLRQIAEPLRCRFNNSDVSVLYQVFGSYECDVELPFVPRVILDGGANVGYVTAYFAAKFPTARILAVEPNEENCRLFEQNCAQFPNVTLVRGAIWHTRTNLRIADPRARAWMVTVEESSGRAAEDVPAYTMGDLLEKVGVDCFDIVKLDIEGAEEALLLQANVGWLKAVKCLFVEVHKAELVLPIKAIMDQWGFSSQVKGEKLVFIKASNCALPLIALGAG
jgi:FkbM family methyltransferase